MSKHNDQTINKTDLTTSKQDSIFGLLARVFWMLLGNMVLVITIIIIFQHKGQMFHTADLVFWITVAVLVLVRYLDIKVWGGLTAAAQPASMADWNRYVVLLSIVSAAFWALSHLVSYLRQ